MQETEERGGDRCYFHRSSGTAPNQSAAHRHETLEIYYMKEGSCHYEIGNASFARTSGDVLLIPAGVTHRTDRYSHSYTRLLINCPPSYSSEAVERELPTDAQLYRNSALSEKIERIFLEIEAEYKRDDALHEEALRSCVGMILILLLRNQREPAESVRKNPIQGVIDYISEYYMTEISLSSLASMCGITPGHLSRTFKRETGSGICEYLTMFRLGKAEFMLRNEPGRTVSEVAYACGFNDSNYFSDKFKKVYGVTPSSVRKSGKT